MTSSPQHRGCVLETAIRVHYNLSVSNARISGHFVLAILCAPLLMGGACEKKGNKPVDTGAVNALDQAGHAGHGHGGVAAPVGTTPDGPVDTTPLAGVDVSKLSGDKLQLFYKLLASLKSPCGKAHSLRTSFASDTSCKRAPFAVRYVVALIEDEASEGDARNEYLKKYEQAGKPVTFDVSKAPRSGAEDARIRLVEFFDYACPHCAQFKAALDQVLAEKGSQVSVYYLMFPLEGRNPQSRSAAQAAIAASHQGKFPEMHARLFAETPRHSRDQVMAYARELGLDMAKFEKSYAEVGTQVTTDLKQGETAGVDSTPTLFFNDRKYEGPLHPRYIGMWIDEEVAVNR
jgi:protein-disulfide isomerase